MAMSDEPGSDLREEVRSRYAEAARAVLDPESGPAAGCCGGLHSAIIRAVKPPNA